MTDVNFEMLIAYLNNELSTEEKAIVAEYLKNTPNAEAELESAHQIIASLENPPLTAPEKNMLSRVQAVFRHKINQQKERLQHEANLTFDSWSHPMPLGVRGAPQERQMLFHKGAFDIDIQLLNDPPTNNLTLRGQILTATAGVDLEGIEIALQAKSNQLSRRSLTDAYGRFSFTQIQNGDYQLKASLDDSEIILTLDDLQIPTQGSQS